MTNLRALVAAAIVVVLCLLAPALPALTPVPVRGAAGGLWTVALAVLLAGGVMAWRFELLTRRMALVVALVSGAAAAGIVAWMHHELRGERPDPGAEPERWSLGGVSDLREVPPPTAPAEPLRLAVWGDCRSGVTVQERLAAELRRRKPTLAVGLGDLVGMARTYQFEIVEERFRATGVPHVFVPGNHDLDPFGTLKPYARVFGAPNWALAVRGVLLVGLDTARGVLDPADVDAAERLVEAHRGAARRTVLCLHHPLYSPEKHAEKPLPEDDATRRLRALVEREGMLVLASHYHGYDVQRHGQVLQIVTGGAGARPESDDPYHYVWLELSDEARFEQVVLAPQSDVSAFTDRLLVFRDEALYACEELPRGASVGLALAVAWMVGALVRAIRGRSSSHSSSASSV